MTETQTPDQFEGSQQNYKDTVIRTKVFFSCLHHQFIAWNLDDFLAKRGFIVLFMTIVFESGGKNHTCLCNGVKGQTRFL